MDGPKALAIDTREGQCVATSDQMEVAWLWISKASRLLVAYMQNFDLKARPPQKDTSESSALPTEDRYLNELAQFLEF